jgi:signal transduction histidine kinase/CheY-like chemotaxis protein
MQRRAARRPGPSHESREIIQALYTLVDHVSRASSVAAIYEEALIALMATVMPDRASVLVFDDAGVMRFRAWHALSPAYRAAVDGHSPWARDAVDPQPIVVPDVFADPSLASFEAVFRAEGIRALAFIPLVGDGQLLGKFMLYYDAPHELSTDELQLAQTIAHHVAFGLRRRAREHEAAGLKDQLASDLTAVMRLHDISQRFLEGEDLEKLLSQILAAVVEITRAARGTLQLRDPERGTLRLVAHQGFGHEFIDCFAHVDAGDAVCGRALQTGQRVIVEDVERDPAFAEPALHGVMQRAHVRAVQSTPLFSKGTRDVLGVISTHFETPHHPSERDLRLIDLFAQQAADVLDHAEAARRREALRAEAEAANRAKDEFIAIVSHELRTPLTAMVGWTRMLRSGQLDAKSSAHALEVIERNLRQQTQILTDLLDVSRIVSGKLTLDLQPVDLAPIIEMAVEIIRPAIDAKRLELTTALDTGVGTVSGDATRLQQVFWNLISNAVKFTPACGRIDVRLERINDRARVSVIDTGRGIAPEFLPQLFERFQQAETGFTRHHGGLGLGLAIVRHLVELHGGHVQASSAGEDQGATFVVELPLTLAPPARAPHVERPEHRSGPKLHSIRVLLVDDHQDTVDFLASALAEYGADVDVATSVHEALGVLAKRRPHVVISDLSMPGEDGFSLMQRIRAQDTDAPPLTAIALTAHARTQDREKALAAGASRAKGRFANTFYRLASHSGVWITDSPRLRRRLVLRPRDVLRLARRSVAQADPVEGVVAHGRAGGGRVAAERRGALERRGRDVVRAEQRELLAQSPVEAGSHSGAESKMRIAARTERAVHLLGGVDEYGWAHDGVRLEAHR